MPSLDGVHAKLARAEKHLKVATRLVQWFARNKCRIDRQPNAETNELDGFLRLEDPPDAIGLSLGDAVHNIRSALDHIVYQLVIANALFPTQKTMFPISDTREGFRSQVKERGRLTGISPQALAAIDGLQPYHRRDKGLDYQAHFLWILDKLENIDKHRRLTITAGLAIGSHTVVEHPTGAVTTHALTGQRLRNGAKLFSLSLPALGQGEMNVKGTLFSTVGFVESEAGLIDADAAGIIWNILDRVRILVIPTLQPFL